MVCCVETDEGPAVASVPTRRKPGLVPEKRSEAGASHNRGSQRPDTSAARATSSKVSGSRPVTSRTVVDTTSISPRAIDV